MKPTWDYLVVGAGWFGSVFARCMTDQGRRCLVIDQRDHIGGNAYTHRVDDIDVHAYGAHIFHTNDRRIWDFVQRFGEFNRYTHRVKARHADKIYSLPFNMNTFYEFWGVTDPHQARARIESQRLILTGPAENLEQQALSMVGSDIYHALVRGYTQKQWNRDPRDLPASIIQRLPLRWTWDDSYFSDAYQGIPREGYTGLFERLLSGIEVRLNQDFFQDRQAWRAMARTVVFTGCIDRYFDYAHGALSYRSLEFQTEILDTDNYQGCAVMNYCDAEVPWTRCIEHRHFGHSRSARTVITRELPRDHGEPYYPVNDAENQRRYRLYRDQADHTPGVIFGGRLADYRYYDMHQVIASALHAVELQGES